MVREDLGKYLNMQPCPSCDGSRLRTEARHVFIDGLNLPQITSKAVGTCSDYFANLKLEGKQGQIADKILKEIRLRLDFLVNVGLDYLTLDRNADTLSGGEAQRIRLASQIGSGLTGVMYVLDEPSIGLHQRDNDRLIGTLKHLRDLGNTVLVVEHDEDTMRAADHIVDLGPGAGTHGGRVVASGTLTELLKHKDSITGPWLKPATKAPSAKKKTSSKKKKATRKKASPKKREASK